MKVLIITSDQIDLSSYDASIDIIDWRDIDNDWNYNINFSDYDGLILDVDSLDKLRTKEKMSMYLFAMESQLTFRVTIDILSNPNSFLCVLGKPTIGVGRGSVSYDLGFHISLKNFEGDNIKKYSSNEHFSGFWNKIHNYKYYITKIKADEDLIKSIGEPVHDIKIYDSIKNRSGYLLGGCFKFVDDDGRRVGLRGEMSFIPPLDDDKSVTINEILGIYLDAKDIPEPEWVKEINVVGQKELDKKINEITNDIKTKRAEKKSLEKERLNLRRLLEVLYKTGKPLEESVAYLLSKLNFKIEMPRVKNKVEFYTTYNEYKFVVEIKSTKKETVGMEGMRQVINWQADKFEESGELYKPLLITLTQSTIKLNKRKNEMLPDNLAGFALKHEICVLPTRILFNVCQIILNGEYNEMEFAKKIYNTNGLFTE